MYKFRRTILRNCQFLKQTKDWRLALTFEFRELLKAAGAFYKGEVKGGQNFVPP